MAYELRLAAEVDRGFKKPRRSATRASREELEAVFKEVEASLQAVDFFKTHNPKPILRTLREVAGRADLDEREAALFKAMAHEVRNYMDRLGRREGEDCDE
jgi:tRNA C32,U32 (ribose-2'-O)-methylase TrmJ